jgi:hypothetical protein
MTGSCCFLFFIAAPRVYMAGTGVDAGLYSGCLAWCDPAERRTNHTFRFDKVRGEKTTRKG